MVLSTCAQEGERGHVNIKVLLGNSSSHEEPGELPRGRVWGSRALPFAESFTSAPAAPSGSLWVINFFTQKKAGGNGFDHRLEATARLKPLAFLVPS